MSNEQSRANDNEARISEADVRRILDRAIQLDTVRTTEVTLAELRKVADEVGISSVALTQAFEEHQLGRVHAPLPANPMHLPGDGWLTRARRMLRPAWLAGMSGVIGLLTAMGGADEPAMVSWVMFMAVSLALAVMHRLRRRDAVEADEAGAATPDQLHDARNEGWSFQLDMLALWVPWSVLNGLAEEEVLAVGSLTWVIAALVGMGIVTLLNPKPRFPGADARGPGRPGAPEAAV